MNPLKIASAFGLAAAVANCVPSLPPYVEPAAQAPHALVKVRLVHHATPGPMYTGSIQLNDRRIEFPIDPAAPATRALRVRPEASSWRFGAEFYHLVTRTESYSTTESYQCGSTTTSYGSTPHRDRPRHRRILRCDNVPRAGIGDDLRGAVRLHGHGPVQREVFRAKAKG
jgi:hypothetical protein